MKNHALMSSPAAVAVTAFHQAFGHPVEPFPVMPHHNTRILRLKLLAEELVELAEACGIPMRINIDDNRNGEGLPVVHDFHTPSTKPTSLADAADAMADLEYVLHGAALCFGVPLQHVFEVVHEANMAKLGSDGKPIVRADGKILKPEGWTKADVGAVLALYEPI